MLLSWFDARQASETGLSLADEYTFLAAPGSRGGRRPRKGDPQQGDSLKEFLRRVERQTHAIPLNFYKKAKLANAFRWRLVEKGIESSVAAKVTHTLVMHLSMNRLAEAGMAKASAAPPPEATARDVAILLNEGIQHAENQAYEKALASFDACLKLEPRNARALNDMGAALCKLGRYNDGEQYFRRAIEADPRLADGHCNLGGMLFGRGQPQAAESCLRRALKLDPNHVDARATLGSTFLSRGRVGEAKLHFERALKIAPSQRMASLGMARIAAAEGQFDKAEEILKGILEVEPDMSSALAAIPALRKMTLSDSSWLKQAEAVAAKEPSPFEEADLRFALGKYYNDVADYPRAFENYSRANSVLRATAAQPYDPEVHTRFVDDLIRVYSKEALQSARASAAKDGPAASTKPVFVVGMPRSGTSLVEQIIASHPAAAGAGELDFWIRAVHEHEAAIRTAFLPASLRNDWAKSYLKTLERHGPNALRVVDKARSTPTIWA